MMIKIQLNLILLFLFVNVAFAQSAITVVDDTLCTPNPTKEAVALYRYLYDMKGKKILSGQMDSSWGIDEFGYIKTHTGKQPAIKGMDFIHQNENANEVKKAIDWWKVGGIPTIMWHWGAPTKGDGYEQSKMAVDIDKCFIEGTAEYKEFWAELKLKADLLQKCKEANVPIIWRPYHELNGNWFWWGKQGSTRFKKLWITMFDYFVKERGLNNLIWVLCYTSNIDSAWYPGDEYVDVVGGDTYGVGDDPQVPMYKAVKTLTRDQFPITYHECGVPPNPDQCLIKGSIWSWWMEWHTDYLSKVDKTYLSYVYNHELVLTLDELPKIVAEYGWADSCKSSAIVPQINIDSTGWQEKNTIQLGIGTSVIIKPQVTDAGVWSWSGMGLKGSSETQTIGLEKIGTTTAKFKNSCGATSTITFNVGNVCPATEIKPYIQVDADKAINISEVSITRGQSLTFAPQPYTGGTWNWSGGTTGEGRVLKFTPDSSCTILATYINPCGTQSQKAFNIEVKNPVGITSTTTKTSLMAYPTPCINQLNIDLWGIPQKTHKMVKVYSSNGEKMLSLAVNDNQFALDVTQLIPGIYQLTINTDEADYRHQFIKINN